MALWMFVGINVVAAIWVKAVWEKNAVDSLLQFAFSNYVLWPVVIVLSLYFAGGVIPEWMRGRKAPKK